VQISKVHHEATFAAVRNDLLSGRAPGHYRTKQPLHICHPAQLCIHVDHSVRPHTRAARTTGRDYKLLSAQNDNGKRKKKEKEKKNIWRASTSPSSTSSTSTEPNLTFLLHPPRRRCRRTEIKGETMSSEKTGSNIKQRLCKLARTNVALHMRGVLSGREWSDAARSQHPVHIGRSKGDSGVSDGKCVRKGRGRGAPARS